MDWPIERKVNGVLGIAIAVLCGMGIIAYALIVSFVNTSNWLIHTHWLSRYKGLAPAWTMPKPRCVAMY